MDGTSEMELAMERRAFEAGEARGIAKGIVATTLRMAKALNISPETVLDLLNANFRGDVIRAKTALEDYLREHPEGEMAELAAAVCEAGPAYGQPNPAASREPAMVSPSRH